MKVTPVLWNWFWLSVCTCELSCSVRCIPFFEWWSIKVWRILSYVFLYLHILPDPLFQHFLLLFSLYLATLHQEVESNFSSREPGWDFGLPGRIGCNRSDVAWLLAFLQTMVYRCYLLSQDLCTSLFSESWNILPCSSLCLFCSYSPQLKCHFFREALSDLPN